MELEVPLADPRGEIDGADQESEGSGECVRDEEMAVGDDLQTVGVVHGEIGDEKNFRSDEDKKRGEAEKNPENGFESGPRGSGRDQGGSCHYLPLRWLDRPRGPTRAKGAKSFRFLSVGFINGCRIGGCRSSGVKTPRFFARIDTTEVVSFRGAICATSSSLLSTDHRSPATVLTARLR